MAAFTFAASKAMPEGSESWGVIPGTGNRVYRRVEDEERAYGVGDNIDFVSDVVVEQLAALRIQNDNLKDVDNVIVVDANEDMEEFWSDMTSDAPQLAFAASGQDSDGFDVFFAGVDSGEEEDEDSPAGGFLNVSNPLYLQEAFRKVQEVGFSTKEAVDETVNRIFIKYLANYKAAEDKSAIKRLNVIVWTDGSFHQGDFETTLVCIANACQKAGVPKTQVGIQLLRVGNVSGVENKFNYFDDELATVHSLDRDMVDHTAYKPNGLAEVITKIFSGALDKKHDNA